MRTIGLLIAAGSVLSACTTAPPQATRTAEGQREYEQLVAGKVAGPPVNCLSDNEMDDMVVIDDSTLAYRLGKSRVYINHLDGVCPGLGRNATMVTKSFGFSGTCRGDIARMVQTGSHMIVGSCTFGEFIPYTRPR